MVFRAVLAPASACCSLYRFEASHSAVFLIGFVNSRSCTGEEFVRDTGVPPALSWSLGDADRRGGKGDCSGNSSVHILALLSQYVRLKGL